MHYIVIYFFICIVHGRAAAIVCGIMHCSDCHRWGAEIVILYCLNTRLDGTDVGGLVSFMGMNVY
jgi:hypothetical protein